MTEILEFDEIPPIELPKLEITMSFSEVLNLLKYDSSIKVTRKDWTKGMYVQSDLHNDKYPYLFIDLKLIRTSYTPSNEDLFADDWIIIGE